MSTEAASRTTPADVPENGTPGRLRTRILEKLTVRIARQRDDQLWLLPLAVDTTELRGLESEPITLECVGGRGLVCLTGQAEVLDSGMIRFRVIDAPQVVQRRRFVRVPLPQPVSIVAGGHQIVTTAVNLSGGGMLLDGLPDLELGDRIHFRLELEEHKPPIAGWAVVVRLGNGGERGFEFQEITRRERERLIHFIFDRQRAAMNVARRAGQA